MMRSLVAPVEGSLRARVESALTSGTRPPTLLERRNLRRGCMNGVDDYPKGTEVTTVAAASSSQAPYAFSQALSPFTGPEGESHPVGA